MLANDSLPTSRESPTCTCINTGGACNSSHCYAFVCAFLCTLVTGADVTSMLMTTSIGPAQKAVLCSLALLASVSKGDDEQCRMLSQADVTSVGTTTRVHASQKL